MVDGLPVTPDIGFEVEIQEISCASLDIGDMKSLVTKLNLKKEHLGCTVFPASSDFDNVVILFAGVGEMFCTLSLAVGLECEVVYFQDPCSFWYQGSGILPDLNGLTSYLKSRIEHRRPIFVGQSSGGYAALVAARCFEKAICLAYSPQTFSDAPLKNRLNVIGDIKLMSAPEGLVDITAYWGHTCNSSRYVAVLFSVSEYDNPTQLYLWADYIHVLRLAQIEGFELFMLPTNSHSFLHGRAKNFSRLLQIACAAETSALHNLLVKALGHIFDETEEA